MLKLDKEQLLLMPNETTNSSYSRYIMSFSFFFLLMEVKFQDELDFKMLIKN